MRLLPRRRIVALGLRLSHASLVQTAARQRERFFISLKIENSRGPEFPTIMDCENQDVELFNSHSQKQL